MKVFLTLGLALVSFNSFALNDAKLDKAFAIARGAIDKTIQTQSHPLLTNFIKENAPKLKAGMDKIEQKIRGGLCLFKGQTDGYTRIVGYRNSRTGEVTKEGHGIVICDHIGKSSAEIIAQLLIHEGSHFVLIENECHASEMEYGISIIGGINPTDSGYLNIEGGDHIGCKIDGSNFSDGNFGYNFSNVLNIKNEDQLAAWHLRTIIRVKGKKVIETLEYASFNSYPDDKVKVYYNTQDFKGHTPLMLAVIEQDKKWVKRILKHSFINVGLKSEEGLTALDYAKKGKNAGILEMVEAYQK